MSGTHQQRTAADDSARDSPQGLPLLPRRKFDLLLHRRGSERHDHLRREWCGGRRHFSTHCYGASTARLRRGSRSGKTSSTTMLGKRAVPRPQLKFSSRTMTTTISPSALPGPARSLTTTGASAAGRSCNVPLGARPKSDCVERNDQTQEPETAHRMDGQGHNDDEADDLSCHEAGSAKAVQATQSLNRTQRSCAKQVEADLSGMLTRNQDNVARSCHGVARFRVADAYASHWHRMGGV